MSSKRIRKVYRLFLTTVPVGLVLAGVFRAWLDPSVTLALLENGLLCR